jgi:DNA-nicking Smr family endonuclease
MSRKRRKKKSIRHQAASSNERAKIFNPVLRSRLRFKKSKESSQSDSNQHGTAEKMPPSDENGYFLKAMADVEPLSDRKKIVAGKPNPDLRPSHPAKDEELEVLTRLSDLVNGFGEMDITFSDEYIEGCVPGFSPKLMRRLKKGQFPIQDHIDLHRLTKNEAENSVREFLLRSHRLGLRCVLVVHGRGLNSENHIPVLKERLPAWLSRGPVKRIVLAFSTARPYDGGTGAIYILLRKRK